VGPLARRRHRTAAVLAAAGGLAACGGDAPSILDPSSDAGNRVAGLWWLMFWISVVVVAVVTGFLLAAVLRGRRRTGGAAADGEAGAGGDAGAGDDAGAEHAVHADDDAGLGDVDRRAVPWGNRFVVVAGMVVPGVILVGTFGFSLGVLDDLSDEPDGALTIEVVSHNWWWELRYPDDVVTANEIHIPVGEPVQLVLPTADVIHSFWVPQLQVKEDHIPGQQNRLTLEADRAGRFRGQCAEFCGLQHAHMEFEVIAQPPAEFEDWLDRQAEPAAEPAASQAEEGREIFERSSCAGCHTVRGTSAEGDLGPDLTHLADRETIGAGLVALTPGNLADFIADPQDDKPGVSMPPSELTPEEIDAVTAYLMELE
jgi:cytochrome c oxidase subunit 2